MEILVGIFILFCAGVITGQSLLYVRSHEGPKKDPAPQAMIAPSPNRGKVVEIAPEAGRDSKGNLLTEQKPKEIQE